MIFEATTARVRRARDGSSDIGIAASARIACALFTFIVAHWVAGGAHHANAQTGGPDLSGRWKSERHGYVLDIERCGEAWCGTRLKPDGSCGAVALRMAQATSGHELAIFLGTLELGPAVQTYKVRASTSARGSARPAQLQMTGGPNAPPQPMTRMIPLHDNLVRDGEASCRAEPKLS